jgi:metacaspase-1
MAKGMSLHVGLNQVDPSHYDGWDGALGACEADATSIEAIARETGYETRVLLTQAAMRQGVRDAIREAADRLVAGDIFLVSYAGHGGQVPDASGDEPDFSDETWCLYNGELIDDELLQLWKTFAPGVRVLVLSDSCHSGTVTRAAKGQLDVDAITNELRAFGIEKPVFRFMPPAVARNTYLANKVFYDELGKSVPTEEGAPAATVRLISGCQDDQTSSDGPFNGLFTGTLLKVWDAGAFGGDYASFHAEIVKRMPSCQTPNHLAIGPSSPAFDQQKPFAIDG